MQALKALGYLFTSITWLTAVLVVALPGLVLLVMVLAKRKSAFLPDGAYKKVGAFWKSAGLTVLFVALLGYLADAALVRYTDLFLLQQSVYTERVYIILTTPPGTKAKAAQDGEKAKVEQFAMKNKAALQAQKQKTLQTIKVSRVIPDFVKWLMTFFVESLAWVRSAFYALFWIIVGLILNARGASICATASKVKF